MICVRFAVCCSLVLAGCTAFPLEAPGDFGAPAGLHGDSRVPPAAVEAAVLADRILRRESVDLLLDTSRRRDLVREIGRVLTRIREVYPAMAEIFVREEHKPRTLLLGLEPKLFEAVSRPSDDQSGSVTLHTGHAEFDALNSKLGLQAMKLFSSTGIVAMYFNEGVNLDAASKAYEMIGGVRYAETDAWLGDGSNIEASKSHGTWYVVVRKAWGDCPAGCMYERMSFFTVDDDGVARIEPSQAKDITEFAEITASRGWH